MLNLSFALLFATYKLSFANVPTLFAFTIKLLAYRLDSVFAWLAKDAFAA